jgi:hypothetical protein
MPRVTLYVKDTDIEVWNRARALSNDSDESLSSLVSEGLRLAIQQRERVPIGSTSLPPDPDPVQDEDAEGEYQHAIDALGLVAKELRRVVDEQGRSLARLEKRLNTLGLGVEAYVVDPNAPTDIFGAETEIGYAKCDGKWQLVTRRSRIRVGGTEPATPLLRSNRLARARAMPLIPQLLTALHAEALRLREAVITASTPAVAGDLTSKT